MPLYPHTHPVGTSALPGFIFQIRENIHSNERADSCFENAGSGAQAENAGYTDRAAQAGNAGFADTLIQAEGTEDAGSRTEENSKRGYALCSQV